MQKPATILSIETASQVCSVAIHQDGALLGYSELDIENAHSAKLLRLVERLFFEFQLGIGEIDAVGVSAGPGSYTGLRIGVSTAKGICFAQDIPLISVDTLSALAFQVTGFAEPDTVILPMMDARRNEIYTAVFSSEGARMTPSHALVVEANPFLDLLHDTKVYFLGDGLEKLRSMLQHPNAIFLDVKNSAVGVGGIAYKKFLNREFEDVAYFEPNYLKEFRVVASKKNPLVI